MLNMLVFCRLFFLLTASLATSLSAQTLPPESVPGELNGDVTQANIHSTICISGWTTTVRPPASYTTKLKLQQMREWTLTGKPRDYEEDHRIPLEIGGNPTDPRNLWPEPWARPHGAREKDRLENAVKRDVCNGVLTLDQARAIFLGNFWNEYKHRFKR